PRCSAFLRESLEYCDVSTAAPGQARTTLARRSNRHRTQSHRLLVTSARILTQQTGGVRNLALASLALHELWCVVSVPLFTAPYQQLGPRWRHNKWAVTVGPDGSPRY